MAELMDQEITALSLANGIDRIYQEFTDAVRALGNKRNGKKLAGSLAHWLVGSHVKTELDIICESFANDMTAHLEMFDMAIEGISEEEKREACAVVVERCSRTVDGNSNSTTDLMKRAMVRLVMKYLPYLSREQLTEVKERLEKAYAKWNRLPVEKDFIKEINRLLGC